jgi:TetR/AcrR family transcriptional regulator
MPALKLDVKRVLRVAAGEFARRGFDGVSMRDIAAAADSSATAIHYHFGSKADLYQEAGSAAYESYLLAIQRKLAEVEPEQRSPEVLAGAMFDEWMRTDDTLLLTSHDAIDALLVPERFLTAAYYPTMLAVIRDAHVRFLGHEIDDETGFSFASMVFGYCALMGIEQRMRQVKHGEQFDNARYVRDKRDALCRLARHIAQQPASTRE